jgi:hypothetical protein
LVFFSVIPLKLSYEKQAPSVSAIQMWWCGSCSSNAVLLKKILSRAKIGLSSSRTDFFVLSCSSLVVDLRAIVDQHLLFVFLNKFISPGKSFWPASNFLWLKNKRSWKHILKFVWSFW